MGGGKKSEVYKFSVYFDNDRIVYMLINSKEFLMNMIQNIIKLSQVRLRVSFAQSVVCKDIMVALVTLTF